MAIGNSNISRKGGDKAYQPGGKAGGAEERGIVIGIVKENAHNARMGNIMVFIPEKGLEGQNASGDAKRYEDDPSSWRMVRYATPWYSRTEVTSKQNNANTVKNVAGMVMPAPDIGTQVLCCFPSGKASEGFWFACAPDPYMMQTLPEITLDDKTKAPNDARARSSVPSGEFNDKATNVQTLQDYTTVERPAEPEIFKQLVAQGFDNDELRGLNNSGYMRETPSEVLGIRTKGRRVDENGTDLKDRPDLLEALTKNSAPTGTGQSGEMIKSLKGYQRRVGHSFTMDDGDTTGTSNQVRIRTSLGHQIILNDTDGVLYINNHDNSASFQMDQMGNVNVVSDQTINFKGRSINFDADDGIKFNAKKNFDVLAEQEINLQSTGNATFISEAIMVAEGKGTLNLGSGGGAVHIDAGGQLHLLSSGGNVNVKGKKIMLQGPAQAAQSRELIKTKKHPRKDRDGEGFAIETLDHESIVDSTGLNSTTNVDIPYEDYSQRGSVPMSAAVSAANGAGSLPAKKGIAPAIPGVPGGGGLPTGNVPGFKSGGFKPGNIIPPGISAGIADAIPGSITKPLSSIATPLANFPGIGGNTLPIPGGGLPDLGGLSKLAEKVPSVSGLAGSLPGAGALSGTAGGLTSGLVPELGSSVGGAGIAGGLTGKIGALAAPGGVGGNPFGGIAQGFDAAQAAQSVTGGDLTSLSGVANNLNFASMNVPAIGDAVSSVGLGNATGILSGINGSLSQIGTFVNKIPGGAAQFGNLARAVGVPQEASQGIVQTLNSVGADGLLGIAKTLPGVNEVLSNGRFVQQTANNLGVEFPMPNILQGGFAAGAFRKRAVGGSELTATPLSPTSIPQRLGSGLSKDPLSMLGAIPEVGKKIATTPKGFSAKEISNFQSTVFGGQQVVTPQGYTNVMPGINNIKNAILPPSGVISGGLSAVKRFDPVAILKAPAFDRGVGGIDAGTMRGMAAGHAEFIGSKSDPSFIDAITGAIGKFGATAPMLSRLGFLKPGTLFNGQMMDPRNWAGLSGITNIESFLGNSSIQDTIFQLTTQANMGDLANLGALFPNDPTDMQGVMANLVNSIGAPNVANLRFGQSLTPVPLGGTTTMIPGTEAAAVARHHGELTSTAVADGLLLNASMNPAVSMENASYLAKPDAADNLAGITQPLYDKMCSFFGEQVPVNDAIPKPASSRETNRPGSKHFHGFALDLGIGGYDNAKRAKLVQAAKQAGFKGFGFGRNILHVDTGPVRHWAYGNTTFAGQTISYWGSYVRGVSV